MIIFGSRMYGKKNVVNGWGRCESCGHYGQLTNYNARKFGHIYFIPLIPNGPPVRVVKECPKCRRGLHFPEAEVDEMVGEFRRDAESAIDALAAGTGEFRRNGSAEPEACLGAVLGPIELLLCFDARDSAEHIHGRLGSVHRGFEQHLVAAAISEFDGDAASAAGAYETAARLDDTNPAASLLAGDMWLTSGELDKALDAYRRAAALDSSDLSPLLGMIDVYTAQGDHWNASETYERIFSLEPDLRNQKKAVKAYKKCCKKANRPMHLV
jgi:tetratricopeptide (TPR) repeat protein